MKVRFFCYTVIMNKKIIIAATLLVIIVLGWWLLSRSSDKNSESILGRPIPENMEELTAEFKDIEAQLLLMENTPGLPDGDMAQAYSDIAQFYLQVGENEPAEELALKALSKDASNTSAQIVLLTTSALTGNFTEGVRLSKQILDQDPTDPVRVLDYAEMLKRSQLASNTQSEIIYSSVMEVYVASLDSVTDTVPVRAAQARLAEEFDFTEEAISYWQQALDATTREEFKAGYQQEIDRLRTLETTLEAE